MGLKSIQPKGLATVATAKDEITLPLNNKKKAEKNISEIG